MPKSNVPVIGTEAFLLHGPMPEISKMTQKDLKEECKMWRNIWGWVPPEVKYYVARTGQDVGITQRNYKRYLGTLLESHWKLETLEMGTVDKVYDAVKDKYYFEKKVVILGMSNIIGIEWIHERKEYEELEAEANKEADKNKEDKPKKEQA